MPISAAEFAGAASAVPAPPAASEKPPTGSAPETAADALLPPPADPASEASQDPYGVATNLTPAGIEVYYQAGPKRLYRVRETLGGVPLEWREVPSVTTVLGVLDKSGALTWWGQGIGGIGALKLQRLGVDLTAVNALIAVGDDDAARKALCDQLTAQKISTNHVKDDAGDRGTSVHTAFEQWAADQRITPQPEVFPPAEQQYAAALAEFLRELSLGGPTDIEAEVMVGSFEHGFAGRYDLRLTLQRDVEMTTRIFPKKPPKREVIPAGRYLLDLKTSKGIYDTHFLQLEAYEAASIECGYEPTDMRAVIHVTKDGRYELARNITKDGEPYATIDDYVDVRTCWAAVERINGRKRG